MEASLPQARGGEEALKQGESLLRLRHQDNHRSEEGLQRSQEEVRDGDLSPPHEPEQGQTSTRDAVERLLLVAVSPLLANLWTHLKWMHKSRIRKGRHSRTVEELLLPYATLLLMFLNATQDNYGAVKAIPSNNRSHRQRR